MKTILSAYVLQTHTHTHTHTHKTYAQTTYSNGINFILRIFLKLVLQQNSVSQNLLFADPFWLRKITTDPHILAHVNIQCPDDRYPKLKIISQN